MANQNAYRDANDVPSILAVDDVTGETVRVPTDSDGNLLVTGSIAGGITGPGSSTDNAIVRWDGTAGDTVQNSGVIIDDSNNITVPSLSASQAVVTDGSKVLTSLAYGITSAATSLVERDASQNAFANNFISKGTNVVSGSGGGTTTMTAASSRIQNLTGSTTQTFQLPDATTLAVGSTWVFNNNSTGVLTVKDGGGTTLTTVIPGGKVEMLAIAVSTTAGSWDWHYWTPANAAWGTAGLTVTGTLQVTGHVTLEGVTSTGATGTGNIVFGTSPTIVTPTIASFTNATHDHTNAAGGGQLTDAALSAAVTVAKGGTGSTTLTANNVILGNGSSAVQFVAPGTSGNVLTSNGTTWTSAAASATPRRNLNIILDTGTYCTAYATSPAVEQNINGISCNQSSDAGQEGVSVSCNAVANWDFYDKNPEINITEVYQAGSGTGNGRIYFGDIGGTPASGNAPTQTQNTKSMFVIAVTSSGTTTYYAVNADGSANTNTSLTGITASQTNNWRIVKNSTTNIKYYCNYTLKATHTTNLPSGDTAQPEFIIVGEGNNTGDTTSRTARYGFLDVLIDSPTT